MVSKGSYQIQPRISFDSKEDFRYYQELSKSGRLKPLISKFLRLYRKEQLLVDSLLERGTLQSNPIADQQFRDAYLEFEANTQALLGYQELLLQQHDNDMNRVIENISLDGFTQYHEATRSLVEVKSSDNGVDNATVMALQQTVSVLQDEISRLTSVLIESKGMVEQPVLALPNTQPSGFDMAELIKTVKAELVAELRQETLVDTIHTTVEEQPVIEDVLLTEPIVEDAVDNVIDTAETPKAQVTDTVSVNEFEQQKSFADDLFADLLGG